MERKIGDFVTVRKDLQEGEQPITGHFATGEMKNYRGQRLRITYIVETHSYKCNSFYAYKICNNDRWWTEDMFEECCL